MLPFVEMFQHKKARKLVQLACLLPGTRPLSTFPTAALFCLDGAIRFPIGFLKKKTKDQKTKLMCGARFV